MQAVLYSTGCPQCLVLKRKLDEKHVAYTEVNDVKAMQKLGFMSAPVLVIDGESMVFYEAIAWVNNMEA